MNTAVASPTITSPTTSRALRRWLLDDLCPWWRERIVDPRGGFFEGLDAAGRPVEGPSQSLLVQARLTYVFSHAFLLSDDPAMRSAAEHGHAHLQRWRETPMGGWARRRSLAGTFPDAARDTYDHAFVVFACAWLHRATGDAAPIALAEEAWAFLEARLADARHGGYFEEHPKHQTLPRRQNPHMHLLEAALAMHAATGSELWIDASRRLVRLMRERLTDHETGSIAEFFNADWSPAGGDSGLLREPGHQFEWAWLLMRWATLRGCSQALTAAHRLLEIGERFGRAGSGPLTGLFIDGVDLDGNVTVPTALFWPQTEYIKACVARAERGIAGMREEAHAHLALLRSRCFRADGRNWCNQLAPDGGCLSPVTPSRVLYHLFLAVAEVIRLEESPQ